MKAKSKIFKVCTVIILLIFIAFLQIKLNDADEKISIMDNPDCIAIIKDQFGDKHELRGKQATPEEYKSLITIETS